MKERPIIFSGPMVRVILQGRKTQTRRKVNTKKFASIDWEYASKGERCLRAAEFAYGIPGDRLWVRETFCIESSREVAYDPPHSDGRPIRHHNDQHWGPWWEQPHYRATDPAPELDIGKEEPGVLWRPSIFMPRWASRITLEITGVRVERLQEISEADAWKEGFHNPDGKNKEYTDRARYWYQTIWESINGPGSWDTNPWVWVLEFKRVES